MATAPLLREEARVEAGFLDKTAKADSTSSESSVDEEERLNLLIGSARSQLPELEVRAQPIDVMVKTDSFDSSSSSSGNSYLLDNIKASLANNTPGAADSEVAES